MKMKILLAGLGLALSTVVGMAQFVLTAGDHTVPSADNWISVYIENNTGGPATPDGYVFSLIIGPIGTLEDSRPQFLEYTTAGTLWESSEFDPNVFLWSLSDDITQSPYTWAFMQDSDGESPEFQSGSDVLMRFRVGTENVPTGSYPLIWGEYLDAWGAALSLAPYSITDAFDGHLIIVPEPASAALLGGLGLLAFAGCRRYRK